MSKIRTVRAQDAPKIEDVAARAGVSTATVSRCLNAPHLVAEATRTRVLGVVRQMGYAPNFGAQALAARRTNTIGAVIPTMENAIFARGLQAFQEALVNEGRTLLVASSSYDPEIEADQIRTLVARGADGLLLIGADRSPDVYAFLAGRGIPVVAAWTHGGPDPSPDAPVFVGFDNAAASYELTEYALRMGHRRFGYISAQTVGNDRARQRVEGAQAALASHGLDPASMRVIETVYSIDEGRRAFADLIAGDKPPTVVMCGNDVLATGAVLMAGEMGLRVPEDVSVTGFDDIELARVTSPALTTIHVPHRQMGTHAARLLLDRMAGKAVAGPTELATRIVDGGSLGPAPG